MLVDRVSVLPLQCHAVVLVENPFVHSVSCVHCAFLRACHVLRVCCVPRMAWRVACSVRYAFVQVVVVWCVYVVGSALRALSEPVVPSARGS